MELQSTIIREKAGRYVVEMTLGAEEDPEAPFMRFRFEVEARGEEPPPLLELQRAALARVRDEASLLLQGSLRR